MLFGVQTDILSQKTQEKFPDISGVWEDKGMYCILFQVKDSIYYSIDGGLWIWYGKGKYVGDNKFNINQVSFRKNDNCRLRSQHTFTLLKDNLIVNEYEYVENGCGVKKGHSGTTTFTRKK
jgi:hypothetical protein